MKKSVLAVLVAAAFVTAQVNSAEASEEGYSKDADVSELQSTFTELGKGIDNLVDLKKTCTKRVGKLFSKNVSEINKLKAEKAKVENNHAALEAEHNDLKKQHSDLKAERDMVFQERIDLQDKHDALVLSNNELKNSHEETKNALEKTNSRLKNALTEHTKNIMRQDAAHKKELAQKDESHRKALEEKEREYKAALEAKEEELKTQLASLTMNLTQAQDELEKQKPSIEVVKTDVDNAVQQLTIVSADIEEVENAIKDEASGYTSVQQEVQ